MSEFEELKKLILISGKNVLSTNEVALVMGVTPEHVRYLTSQGEFPHYPKGNRNYYKKDEIEAYLTEVRVPSQKEIEAEAAKRNYELISRAK